jgi:hypothetical protein
LGFRRLLAALSTELDLPDDFYSPPAINERAIKKLLGCKPAARGCCRHSADLHQGRAVNQNEGDEPTEQSPKGKRASPPESAETVAKGLDVWLPKFTWKHRKRCDQHKH